MKQKIEEYEIEYNGEKRKKQRTYLEFEEDEEKYFLAMIKRKKGILFIQELLVFVLDNLKPRDYKVINNNKFYDNKIILSIPYSRFRYIDSYNFSAYYIKNFMRILIKGKYIILSKGDSKKNDGELNQQTVYQIRVVPFLVLILPYLDEIKQRVKNLTSKGDDK